MMPLHWHGQGSGAAFVSCWAVLTSTNSGSGSIICWYVASVDETSGNGTLLQSTVFIVYSSGWAEVCYYSAEEVSRTFSRFFPRFSDLGSNSLLDSRNLGGTVVDLDEEAFAEPKVRVSNPA